MDPSAPRWERRTELWAYFALAYGLTWAVHIPVALAAKGILDLHLPPGLHFLGAAVLVRLFTGLWPALNQFGHIAEFPNLNWLAGWALWTVAFGFGEETGWRGFALPRLQRDRSARSATLLLGAAWCLWHLPSFFYNYPGMNLFGVVAFVVSLMSGAVVLTWLYNSTGGSILAAALWHGAFNAAVASGEGPMSALVSAFVILAAVVIGRWAGPEDLCLWGKQTM